MARVRSYGMNSLLGSHQFDYHPTSPFRVYRKVSDLGRPPVSEHVVFIDEHEDSINDGFFFVGVNSEGVLGWIDLPAARHNSGANLTFADGHVETKRWEDKRTLKPVERKTFTAIKTPGNPDVLWLWKRATAPQ